jgi:hypothetical protein
MSKIVIIKIYRAIITPVFLVGCETWSLILREEHRMRMFESRVLWTIFRRRRDEIIGDWKECTRGAS